MTESQAGLTIDQILGTSDRPVKEVPCPEWGGSVYVRPMSGFARGQYDADRAAAEDDSMMRVWLFRAGACDQNGKPLEISDRQLNQLAEKNAAPIERVALAVLKVSGILEDVEEAAKNSPDDQNDASG